nr:hypothetical protein [Tanacetum cinerariifolium]
LFRTLCLLNYALMIRHDYDITYSLRRRALQMVYHGIANMALTFRGVIVQLSSAAHVVLITRPACRPSLVSCLSSIGESLPFVPDAYVVAVSGVPGAKTRMHTPAPGESEA